MIECFYELILSIDFENVRCPMLEAFAKVSVLLSLQHCTKSENKIS